MIDTIVVGECAAVKASQLVVQDSSKRGGEDVCAGINNLRSGERGSFQIFVKGNRKVGSSVGIAQECFGDVEFYGVENNAVSGGRNFDGYLACSRKRGFVKVGLKRQVVVRWHHVTREAVGVGVGWY